MEAYKQTVTKKEFLKELKWHQKADAFVKGSYWDGKGKGCAVGCSLNSVMRAKGLKLKHNDHSQYPIHLGIPEWLARVEDTIFEGLSVERSKTWPVEFAQAIKTGTDLEGAKVPFLVLVLKHSLKSMSKAKYNAERFPQVKAVIEQVQAAVKQMIQAHQRGDREAIEAARMSAYSARSAAYSAAYSAADSARSAADSAYSAAYSAYSAAYSAADSARSAAYSAYSAYSAADSAREKAYAFYADGLIEILKKCK